jgi:NAD+ synthase
VEQLAYYIVQWLSTYCREAQQAGFIVGISGGVDSALTSTLCAKTGMKTIVLSMPIHQQPEQLLRARNHMDWLQANFSNVQPMEMDLTAAFESLRTAFPLAVASHELSMANTRSRLRMTTLYAVGQTHRCLVAGTGNKIEDFGVGFYTKYGDGGVDLSPIADLTKTEVWNLSKYLGILQEITSAKPTDGLWGEDRTDEDQLGATYPELEWAMEFKGDESSLTARQHEVLAIYRRFNQINRHKMEPIPVCKIPKELRA